MSAESHGIDPLCLFLWPFFHQWTHYSHQNFIILCAPTSYAYKTYNIVSSFKVGYSGPIFFFRSKLQFSVINYFWYFHSRPLDGHERKVQAGDRRGEQRAYLPNNLFRNCKIRCFHQNLNGKCNTPQMAQMKRPMWRGYLQSDGWGYRGTQGLVTDESCYASRAEGQGEELV